MARYWYASIYNFNNEPRDFSVSALCSQDSDATVEVQSFTLPNFLSGGDTALCPLGKRVVGGGVNTTGPVSPHNNYTVELSGPVDETGLTVNTEDGDVARAWYAHIWNASAGQQEFKIIALCSQASDATVEVQPFSAELSAAAVATCPAGKRALGGGVNTTGPVTPNSRDYEVELSGPLPETGFIVEDGDVARHWFASIMRRGTGGQQFKTIALCASDAAGPGGGGGDGGGGAGGGPSGLGCANRTAAIFGTAGADTVTGTAKADVIHGLGGNDKLFGLGGNDRICGGPGRDTIRGGKGRDRLFGGMGRDRLFGGPGLDRLFGGPGVDVQNQ